MSGVGLLAQPASTARATAPTLSERLRCFMGQSSSVPTYCWNASAAAGFRAQRGRTDDDCVSIRAEVHVTTIEFRAPWSTTLRTATVMTMGVLALVMIAAIVTRPPTFAAALLIGVPLLTIFATVAGRVRGY